MIHFEHTGKDEVAKILPRSQLDGVLSVAYVGTKQDWNEKITTAQKRQAFLRRYPQTSINVEKVYRFLLLKKALDPAYRDVQIDVRNFRFVPLCRNIRFMPATGDGVDATAAGKTARADTDQRPCC